MSYSLDFSIIIPSYNTKDLLIKCLKSLKSLKLQTEIIVVDNGSRDGTVEELKTQNSKLKTASQKLKVIENDKNLGFAKAVNQGLKMAEGKYLLLLNSDMEVFSETLVSMIQFIDTKPKVGVVGCQLRNRDGTIQPSGGYLPNLFNLTAWALFLDDLPVMRKFFPAYHVEEKSFYEKERKLGWVTGAFFLTKKEVVEKVSWFDEKMFMYVEEVDWCQRVKNAGYQVVFSPQDSVVHYKGASSAKGELGELGRLGILEEFRGLKYFFQKHKPQWQSSVLRIILKIAALARIIGFGIILNDKKKREIYVKAFRLV